MSHPLIIAGKVLSPIVRQWLARYPRQNDVAFAKVRQDTFEDWTIEVDLRTQEQYEDLSTRIADLEGKLAELGDELTYTRVYANYARAADVEAIDERRRMLAFAAAALIDMRLTAAQHSRVERLLRELDPDDARWLNVIHHSRGTQYKERTLLTEDAVRWAVWQDSTSADILAASACVRVTHKSPGMQLGAGPGRDEVTVTSEGRMVLQVLRLYLLARTPPIEIPGQDATGPAGQAMPTTPDSGTAGPTGAQ